MRCPCVSTGLRRQGASKERAPPLFGPGCALGYAPLPPWGRSRVVGRSQVSRGRFMHVQGVWRVHLGTSRHCKGSIRTARDAIGSIQTPPGPREDPFKPFHGPSSPRLTNKSPSPPTIVVDTTPAANRNSHTKPQPTSSLQANTPRTRVSSLSGHAFNLTVAGPATGNRSGVRRGGIRASPLPGCMSMHMYVDSWPMNLIARVDFLAVD